MNYEKVNGVHVYYPQGMALSEAEYYLSCQLAVSPRLRLCELWIELDGGEVLLTPHYDTVVRVRRITGYLSCLKNFNNAKRDEAGKRVKHDC